MLLPPVMINHCCELEMKVAFAKEVLSQVTMRSSSDFDACSAG